MVVEGALGFVDVQVLPVERSVCFAAGSCCNSRGGRGGRARLLKVRQWWPCYCAELIWKEASM